MSRSKRTLLAMVRRWEADAEWLRATFGEYAGQNNDAITETMRNIDTAAGWGRHAGSMSDDAWNERRRLIPHPQETI